MVLNWLVENPLSCINLTNGYYPKKFDTLPGTPKQFDIDHLCCPKIFNKK
jgi:hypothetical protein